MKVYGEYSPTFSYASEGRSDRSAGFQPLRRVRTFVRYESNVTEARKLRKYEPALACVRLDEWPLALELLSLRRPSTEENMLPSAP